MRTVRARIVTVGRSSASRECAAHRTTVATLMDIAGLSARAAADQLGHAKVSMTQDHYMGCHTAKTGAAKVMESIIERS